MSVDPYSGEFSARRQALDTWILAKVEAAATGVVSHWLFTVNLINGLLFGLAFLAPLLSSLGAWLPAQAIYFAYSFVCHQLPTRSYFIFGYQVAQCQRNTAIFAALLVCGLAFALVRKRLKPIDWRLCVLLVLPMAIDGTTQLFGWRESNWELRTTTGALFGLACVLFAYPYVDRQVRFVAKAPRVLQVVVYGKHDCPLCDKSKAILDRVAQSYPLHIEEVDIMCDLEAKQRYELLIPVVHIDGRVAAVGKVSELWLRRVIEDRLAD